MVEVERWVRPNLVEADPGLEVGAEGFGLAAVVPESEALDFLHAEAEGHAGRDFLHKIQRGFPDVAVVEMRSVHVALSGLLPGHSSAVVVGQLAVEAAFVASVAQILMVQALHERFA